jgi:hypothetical protein
VARVSTLARRRSRRCTRLLRQGKDGDEEDGLHGTLRGMSYDMGSGWTRTPILVSQRMTKVQGTVSGAVALQQQSLLSFALRTKMPPDKPK